MTHYFNSSGVTSKDEPLTKDESSKDSSLTKDESSSNEVSKPESKPAKEAKSAKSKDTTSKKVIKKDQVFIFNPKAFIRVVEIEGKQYGIPAKKGKWFKSEEVSFLEAYLKDGRLLRK